MISHPQPQEGHHVAPGCNLLPRARPSNPLPACVCHDSSRRTPIWPCDPLMSTVLLAHRTDERHGCDLMQEVANLTDGELQLEPGTLYPARCTTW